MKYLVRIEVPGTVEAVVGAHQTSALRKKDRNRIWVDVPRWRVPVLLDVYVLVDRSKLEQAGEQALARLRKSGLKVGLNPFDNDQTALLHPRLNDPRGNGISEDVDLDLENARVVEVREFSVKSSPLEDTCIFCFDEGGEDGPCPACGADSTAE